MPAPLDFYPHILQSILDYASAQDEPGTLVALRQSNSFFLSRTTNPLAVHVVFDSTATEFQVYGVSQHLGVRGTWPTFGAPFGRSASMRRREAPVCQPFDRSALASVGDILSAAVLLDLKGWFPSPAQGLFWSLDVQRVKMLRIFHVSAMPLAAAFPAETVVYFLGYNKQEDVTDAFFASPIGAAGATKIVINIEYDPNLNFIIPSSSMNPQSRYGLPGSVKELVVIIKSTKERTSPSASRDANSDSQFLFSLFLYLAAYNLHFVRVQFVNLVNLPSDLIGCGHSSHGAAESNAEIWLGAALEYLHPPQSPLQQYPEFLEDFGRYKSITVEEYAAQVGSDRSFLETDA
ncbi:uncharacterized protein LOC62_05G007094 [Vanrija pseudolonga]|uniref:Uncharacterized protein n=1 Tax=Vanrija pseudolonga TaxID=143232 RepID=A0AAF1BJK9_9TREE|nr:hypothetical protein LOC62_05G007094 [Vanrija pseudolonga]